MGLRVGSLGYATMQGLGLLAKAFYDNRIVTDFMIINHGRRDTHPEWYPDAEQITSLRDANQFRRMKQFCSKQDVMLFFETPFRWDLIEHCRQSGVKTFLMPMYECMPKQLPAQPDRFLCPSLLDLRYFPERSEFIPVPVDQRWHWRERAKVFVHNAGHGGLRGRNGTRELVDALQYIESDAQIIIRTQSQEVFNEIEPLVAAQSSRVDVHLSCGTIPSDKLYKEGDVFIFPEKFNGLSLPLQEARASGMLVMATDRFPMNTWLPREPLIPVHRYDEASVGGPCVIYEEAVITPKAIAAKIDEWYNQDIFEYSHSALAWADTMSWRTLAPLYLKALSQ